MAERLPHIFYENPYQSSKFTSVGSSRNNNEIKHRICKKAHSQKLFEQFEKAWNEAEEKKKSIGITESKGIYLEFFCDCSYGLGLKSLENLSKGIRLLKVSEYTENSRKMLKVLVFIPKEHRSFFLKRIEAYANKLTRTGKPSNQALIESIEAIKMAVLESFWKELPIFKNDEDSKWCEAWIRMNPQSSDKEKEEFASDLNRLGVEKSDGFLDFKERSVFLIKANKTQLSKLIEICPYITEFHLVCEINYLFFRQDNTVQSNLVESILKRLEVETQKNISIMILDTGVNNGHKLLSPILIDKDCHSIYSDWGTEDHDGHGTEMAGICGFGDLGKILLSSEKIILQHKLESCKILPPKGYNENKPELYGYITQQAVYNKDIEEPGITRIICMAIASDTCADGHPSSWSAAIDQLAFGEPDHKKLVFLPAGNIDQQEMEAYPKSNIEKPIRNPGQSWNALTIGAYTQKDRIIDEKYSNLNPIAKFGEISPSSSSSIAWIKDANDWPNKPDLLLEGGNYCCDDQGRVWQNENLHLLTTHFNPQVRQFSTISDTSAATALAAKMASQIQVKYPEYWPETIRALMVHSANWTKELKQQFGVEVNAKKQKFQELLRIGGYGVPNLERALYSASNHCNLIIQREIQPYFFENNKAKTNEMHLYELPWPKEVLRELGEKSIILKITLSYFIDPSPGEIGWHDRYRYASHGLRFDINRSTEDETKFRKRINKADQDDCYTSEGLKDKWLLGVNQRNHGTIHSDSWEGTAVDLAEQNLLAIYPVLGWWKERKHLGKCNSKTRYSLIISIESPSIEIDLYNLVLSKIKAEQKVAARVEVTG